MAYRNCVKHFIDVVFSSLGLILLSPLFLILYLLVKHDSKGPGFFRQKRVGKNKEIFTMLKFRTMQTSAPKNTTKYLLKNPYKYITPMGRFLRITSLDELPQLVNILKGEMSLIGPRPALWNQYDLIAERDRYGANDVLPGLSGWAQVNGRDELSIKTKVAFDGEYVRKMSFWFDAKCFWKTFGVVISADGIVEGNTYVKT